MPLVAQMVAQIVRRMQRRGQGGCQRVSLLYYRRRLLYYRPALLYYRSPLLYSVWGVKQGKFVSRPHHAPGPAPNDCTDDKEQKVQEHFRWFDHLEEIWE